MAHPWSNKKIRGWNKQIRKIECWKNYPINLDIDNFLTQTRDYVKITIDPWYRIVKRNPPIWYDRLILESLIVTYFNWRKTLQELRKPSYGKIWLYEPHFIRFQVVAGFGKSHWYKDDVLEYFDELKAADIDQLNQMTSHLRLDEYEKKY